MTPDQESGIISLVAKRKLRFLHTQGKKFAFVTALRGGVSEWFMELVLKTSDLARDQGFESLPLRQFDFQVSFTLTFHIASYRKNGTLHLEKYPSGEGAPLLRE